MRFGLMTGANRSQKVRQPYLTLSELYSAARVELQNTIDEIQILEGHEDIVRLLIKIDEHRYSNLPHNTGLPVLLMMGVS